MPPRLLCIVVAVLTGCTSVTHVEVAPDQLQALAGIGPDEERNILPRGEAATRIVKGSDPLRLQVSPEWTARAGEQPWGRLSTLHWGVRVRVAPTVAPGEGDPGIHAVPLDQVTGGELALTQPNPTGTAGVVLGIVTVILAAGVALGVAVIYAEVKAVTVAFGAR